MRRLLRGYAAALCACLLLALGPVPASAGSAGGTLWVDGDGMAGPNTCGQTTAAYTYIQGAIDAALQGDTIKVCPGAYFENLVFNFASGVTLISTDPFKAIIFSPDDQSLAQFPGQLLTVNGSLGIKIQGFVIKAKTWGTCEDTDAAIRVTQGSSAEIVGNEIRPSGKNTFEGACHLLTGIQVDGSSLARISYNLIKDWIYSGVSAADGSRLILDWNSLRLRHAQYTGASCLGAAVWSYESLVRARHNQINEPEGDHPCPGIGFDVRGGKAHIISNTIDGMNDGIVFGINSVYPRHPEVRNNTITNTDPDGVGIQVYGGSGGNIHDNNLAGNNGVDCDDDTTGSVTFGTANTWANNTGGGNDDPDGICP